MISTAKWLHDFSHLFFPHTCAGCGSDLLENDQTVCLRCQANLPETGFFALPGNPIEKIFYGRLEVKLAGAGYYFTKSSVLQRLIHQLKYKGNQEVGHQLGQWLGIQLKNSGRFNGIDALIPLPLFLDKEKKRGYNQAAVLSEGIADILNVAVLKDIVLRKRFTDTQTKKGRSERWVNVEGSFEISNPSLLQNKKLLLVDDVITTGATMEACGHAIKQIEQTELSIATLAWASNDYVNGQISLSARPSNTKFNRYITTNRYCFLIFTLLKTNIYILLILVLTLAASCSKEKLDTGSESKLTITNDSLHFDTVFTTAGSITKYFIIKNENRQKIRINNLQLMGGSASNFKINVDGSPGVQFNGIEIEGNDSMYVFVNVNVNPNAANQPFVIRDSIKIEWNGNTSFKQLEAWGQNANYIRSTVLKGNFSWNKTRPYVILGGLIVDTNSVLTIQPGTRIYLNADAPFIVDGTLIVNGTKSDSVVFRGNRLDDPYKDYPGAWPGIYFRGSSINNNITYTYINNAYQGLVAEKPSTNANPKLTLNNCVLDNIYDIGLFGISSSIVANNCLISNCGNNIALIYGGTYQFNHCTVVTVSSSFIQHKNPVVTATNYVKQNNQTFTAPLNATFTNSILWGDRGLVDNEVLVQKEGTDVTSLVLQNVLFKAKTDPSNTSFTNVIRNTDPQFDSVDVVKRLYNFRLKTGSTAINKGIVTPLLTDFDGLPRVGLPDLGAYEKQ